MTINGRIFLFGKVIRKTENLVRKNTISIMHGVTFANDLILKISSLPYYKIDFNLIDLIESLQIKLSLVKRSKLPVHKEFRPSRIGHAPLLDCKGSQFKSSPSNFRSKTLYLSNLQTSPLIFVDNSD